MGPRAGGWPVWNKTPAHTAGRDRGREGLWGGGGGGDWERMGERRDQLSPMMGGAV